jgi:hypothetical protein
MHRLSNIFGTNSRCFIIIIHTKSTTNTRLFTLKQKQTRNQDIHLRLHTLYLIHVHTTETKEFSSTNATTTVPSIPMHFKGKFSLKLLPTGTSYELMTYYKIDMKSYLS